MGYSLAASIGACIANDGKRILCIIGDGRLFHRRSKTPSGPDIVHEKLDGEAHEDTKRGRRLTGQ
ncbi:MAG: thiamine pyrophosphate-dependent enzyme [Fibrobacterota bacterium]|nr:thiamine pyrophosphate-dependent enzyme [Fibrobacterota bacterium]